jgi:hypothetical protein
MSRIRLVGGAVVLMLSCGATLAHRQGAVPSPAATAVNLPVRALPTDFGLPDETAPAYVAKVQIEVAPVVRIGAYGAAGHIWLAPQSWTGRASVGVDGNTVVRIYPAGRIGTRGARIIYTSIPACVACILSEAAPYFPDAQQQWDERFNRDGKNPIHAPRGLTLTRTSPHLVRYRLPDEGGLIVRGVAFYNGTEEFEGIHVVLPAAEEQLSEFLLMYFSDRAGHDCSPSAICR